MVEKAENVFGGLVLTDESIDAVEEERKRRDPEPPLQRGRRRFRSPRDEQFDRGNILCGAHCVKMSTERTGIPRIASNGPAHYTRASQPVLGTFT